jgi:hypothetical protein
MDFFAFLRPVFADTGSANKYTYIPSKRPAAARKTQKEDEEESQAILKNEKGPEKERMRHVEKIQRQCPKRLAGGLAYGRADFGLACGGLGVGGIFAGDGECGLGRHDHEVP